MDKYQKLVEKFEHLANEERAGSQAAYMRNQFKFYGLSTPDRRTTYKSLFAEEKRKGEVDWEFLDRCWDNEHREFQYFVIDYLWAMEKCLKYEDMGRIERYVRSKQWWDTIDGLSPVIGNMALSDKRISDLMLKWSKDDDFWVRRVAIDHQLGRKQHTDTGLLEKILVANFGSSEFFINKAIGWSLRDYSKTNPKWVRGFIEKYRDKLHSLSIREGSKYC